MCRLLGLVANKPVDLRFSLIEGPKTLAKMSCDNPDGWGLGWYPPEGPPRVVKDTGQATASGRFGRTAAEGVSKIFIAHVRKASVGESCAQNCHPFQSDKWLFAHNGTVHCYETLKSALSENHQKAIRGETDSEVFFHWLLQNIESSRNVVEGLRKAIHAVCRYDALNFLLSDGTALYAYRDATQRERHYTLYWLLRAPEQEDGFAAEAREVKTMLESKALRGERAVLVCSEKLTKEPWKELSMGQLLRVDKNLSHTCFKIR